MAPFSRITSVARRQHRVISYQQLKELGFSPDAVRHLERKERLWRVYVGVYALEGPLTPEGGAMAAVLACRGAVANLSAAFLTGAVDARPMQTHILVIGRTGVKGPKGVKVHHARQLTKADLDRHQGIPITSPARTIIDCSPLLGDRPLKELLRRYEHDGLDLTTLDRPRIPKNLKRLLNRYVIGSGFTANQLEQCFYEICASIEIPRPEIQAWFPEKRRVDFVWHDYRLIAETDGRRAHGSFIAFTDDRVRDRAHLIAGYDSMRFTWTEVQDREPVATDLLAFFSRRRGWGRGAA